MKLKFIFHIEIRILKLSPHRFITQCSSFQEREFTVLALK